MMGIDVLEHTERQLTYEETLQLYESQSEEVSCVIHRRREIVIIIRGLQAGA